MSTTIAFRPGVAAALAALVASPVPMERVSYRRPLGSLPVSKWSGADLRLIRSLNGVGRPPQRAAA